MKKIYNNLLFFTAFLGFFLVVSCVRENWEDHYSIKDERVHMKVWDAIKANPDYSEFVKYIEQFGIDSIFGQDQSFTLFVPGNDEFASFDPIQGFLEQTLLYYISKTVYIGDNQFSKRKLQTLSGKYIDLEGTGSNITVDGIPVNFRSPLFLDGCYYDLSDVIYPKPNLYEYTAIYSSVIRNYIDSQDSVYLDRALSTPIGFDTDGNTLYDSVIAVVNRFERDFFPVSMEFRDRSATLLIFTQEQYDDALDAMARDLGGGYHDHQDIPQDWQFDLFLPLVLSQGVFPGTLPYVAFYQDSLRNIQGDTVLVDYRNIDPGSKFVTSNGVVYNYSNFVVDDSLYFGYRAIEGEDLVDSISPSQFVFSDDVIVKGEFINPVKAYYEEASKDYLISVTFPRNYSGIFSIEMGFDYVFPGRYRLEWRANYRPGGKFNVYVNDVYTGQFDTYNFRKIVQGVTGEVFIPDENGFNTKDFWVNNIDSYGQVNVRFEYAGSGVGSNNGFSMDYVRLVPVLN